MTYIYENIHSKPNLLTSNELGEAISGIHYDVENSEMTDKSLSHCSWNEDEQKLYIVFINELTTVDKTELDVIVENNY